MKLAAMVYSVNAMMKAGEIDQNGFIALCAGFKLDGVELFDNLIGGETPEARRRALSDVKASLAEHRLKLASYVVHNDFTDPKTIPVEAEKVMRAMDDALFLEAGVVRVLGGGTHKLNGQSREQGLKNVIAGLKTVAKAAEAKGVVLALENHGDLPGRGEEVRQVIDAVDSPALKVCFDIGNFLAGNMAVKQDPAAALRHIAKDVRHVHVKDRRFAPGKRGDVESCVCGTGAAPLAACLKILREVGYAGFVSIECEGEEGLSNLAAFMNSAANVRTAIERSAR